MEWKEYKLGDVITYKKGFAFKSSQYKKSGRYIVRISDTTNDSININSCNCIDPLVSEQYNDYELYHTDIIIATVGSWPNNPASIVGKVVRVPIEADGALLNQNAVRIRTNSSLSNSLLYYILKNQSFSKYIVGKAQGSANQASITLKDILAYSFKLPSSTTLQQKIANILSSLDAKIENNNKINANLEAQAAALFKSWFVDFEPFRNGEFVESELGMIPKGWKVGKLGDICCFKRGKNLLSKNAINEGIPVVAGGIEPSCYHNQYNAIAPVVTISGSGANAGYMRMYHENIWASDCSFIDKNSNFLYFVYCFLSTNRHLLKHAQTGAVQPHVKSSDVHEFDIVVPPVVIIEKFQSIIKELMSRVGKNILENQRLSSLRDTLLPKLMSGEIDLDNISI